MASKSKGLMRPCPSWQCQGQERNFVKVVSTFEHIPDSRNLIMGPGGRGQIRQVDVEVPLARCSKCGIVVYVGSTLEE